MQINDKLIKRNVITCSRSSGTSYAGDATIAFNSNTIIGNKLSYNSTNNTVVIGNGVSKVLVSGQIYWNYNATNSNTYGALLLKGTSEIHRFQIYKTASSPISASGCPVMVDVQAGDEIKMTAINTASSAQPITGTKTFLTVEVME